MIFLVPSFLPFFFPARSLSFIRLFNNSQYLSSRNLPSSFACSKKFIRALLSNCNSTRFLFLFFFLIPRFSPDSFVSFRIIEGGNATIWIVQSLYLFLFSARLREFVVVINNFYKGMVFFVGPPVFLSFLCVFGDQTNESSVGTRNGGGKVVFLVVFFFSFSGKCSGICCSNYKKKKVLAFQRVGVDWKKCLYGFSTTMLL